MRKVVASHRGLTLIDLIVLVVAIGIMLWMSLRCFGPDQMPSFLRVFRTLASVPDDAANQETLPTRPFRVLDEIVYTADWLETLLPSLIVWSMALFLLALRKPRPSLRKLSRQPGFLACLMACLIPLIEVSADISRECLLMMSTSVGLSEMYWSSTFLDSLSKVPGTISFVIAATWLAQAICGRWRPAQPGSIASAG